MHPLLVIGCLGLGLSPQRGGQGPDPDFIACVAHRQYSGNGSGMDEHKWGGTLQGAHLPNWTVGPGCYSVSSREQTHNDLCEHNWVLLLSNVATYNPRVCPSAGGEGHCGWAGPGARRSSAHSSLPHILVRYPLYAWER